MSRIKPSLNFEKAKVFNNPIHQTNNSIEKMLVGKGEAKWDAFGYFIITKKYQKKI